jgi:hypothetical protein
VTLASSVSEAVASRSLLGAGRIEDVLEHHFVVLGELNELHVGLKHLFAVIEDTARGGDPGGKNPVGVGIRIAKSYRNIAVFLERLPREKAAAVNADVLDIGSVRGAFSEEFLPLNDHRQVLMEGAVRIFSTHDFHPLSVDGGKLPSVFKEDCSMAEGVRQGVFSAARIAENASKGLHWEAKTRGLLHPEFDNK